MPMATTTSCTTAGFTKRSYHTKELMCMFDADHVTPNDRIALLTILRNYELLSYVIYVKRPDRLLRNKSQWTPENFSPTHAKLMEI